MILLRQDMIWSIKKIAINITVEIAVPCENQSEKRNAAQRLIYDDILGRADKITLVQKSYDEKCYQKRNEYMIDNSSLLIACFDGKAGGTKKHH